MAGARSLHVWRAVLAGFLLLMGNVVPISAPTASAGTLPALTISDARQTESNSLEFAVRLSKPSNRAVSFYFSTADGTAKAGEDYVPVVMARVTFDPGQLWGPIGIAVVLDTLVEPNETLRVILSSPARATISDKTGIGTIVNDDTAPPTQFKLTVAKTGLGTGTVTSSNTGGIACGTDCTQSYPRDSIVTLTAAPAPGSLFTGWSGGGCSQPIGHPEQCTVTMSADRAVQADFGLPQGPRLLTVWIDGYGSGTVTSDPPGIHCHWQFPVEHSGTCEARFEERSTVNLRATPDDGSRFGNFYAGCDDPSSPTCPVTMDHDKGVFVNFCPPNNPDGTPAVCMPY